MVNFMKANLTIEVLKYTPIYIFGNWIIIIVFYLRNSNICQITLYFSVDINIKT